jgi:hypothetical protein
VVDFYDRGRGVEVDPFLRIRVREAAEGKSARLRRLGLTFKRLTRRARR